MPMPPYPILCSTPGCNELAEFKVASGWSDGVMQELKTYGLCCPACLPARFILARQRQARCRLVPGETLEPPGIYELTRLQRDKQRRRRGDLEEQLLADQASVSPS